MKNGNENSNLKSPAKTKDEFATSDFYLSVFLVLKEFPLIGIDRETPQHCKFIFPDSPHLQKLVKEFQFGLADSKEILIDARKIATTIKELKSKLYA